MDTYPAAVMSGDNSMPTFSPHSITLGESADTTWLARLATALGRGGALSLVLALMDALVWVGCYALLATVRQHYAMDASDLRDADAHAAVGAVGFQTSVCLIQFAALTLCLFVVGGYDRRTSYMSLGYMSEHLIAIAAAAMLGALSIYAGAVFSERGMHPSRGAYLSSLLAFAPLSLMYRRSLGQMLRARMSQRFLVVLGTGDSARRFHESYRADCEHQPRLCFVDPSAVDRHEVADARRTTSLNEGAPVGQKSLAKLAEQSCGVVVIEDTKRLRPELLEWLTRLHYEDVPVYTLETFHEKHWRRVPVDSIEATWPWETESHLAGVSAYSHAKRLLDIVVAGAALLLLSPLFAVLALCVRLDSAGPVFFSQQRIGRDRRLFWVYKFRSMRVRAPGEEGSLYTDTKDPRITRVGGWLRKLRLDELPQLWNVVRGDMSLIGPRAEWDRLVDGYEKAIPFYHFRHLVKPGITGWAQVNYPYGANLEDTVQKLKYDLYYIRYYSLRLDAMIVLKTLHIMIWGKGQ